MPLSEVEGDNSQPVVDLPKAGLPAPVIALFLGVVAVGLFVFLEGARARHEPRLVSPSVAEAGTTLASPPALDIPPPQPPPPPQSTTPPPPPPARVQVVERPAPPRPPIIQFVDRPAPAPPPSVIGRQNEPPLVIDLGEVASTQSTQGEDATARATILRNRSLLVPQGTLIAAVLETPIDSTRPGLVRALTSADTHGFDGARVLIPRGSRLVGDYKSDIQTGQKRVIIAWTRLVRPDGVAIRLASPASDTVGGAGVVGEVNNHILARFSNVVLQTALTVGVNLASNPGNGSVVVGSPAQSVAGAGQTLLPTQDLKPTITVREGAEITVFVARDLDFSGALPRP